MTPGIAGSTNILFTWDSPFADGGGVGRVTEVLAAEFLRKGWQVTYLALCGGRQTVNQGITQYFLPDEEKLGSAEHVRYVTQLLKDLQVGYIINQAGTKIEVLDFLQELHIKHKQPVLSVHHNCVACLRENYRHILTESFQTKPFFWLIDHAPGWLLLDRYHLVKQGRVFKKAIEVSDRLVLLSKVFVPEVQVYVSDYPEHKVVGIPNPASFPVVEGVEKKKENRLVYVGRINYQQKRVDLLLDLWSRIYRDFPGWHFDIVGDGPDLEDLKRKAEGQRLERIFFHGYQDPRPYLEKAKFFCMTSAFEGYPMVLVEAQAYGVVPFAFNSFSAIEDIIQPGQTGCILPKFDLAKYAEALQQLMRDEEQRIQMAQQGQASVGRYTPERIVDRWLALIEEVELERKGISR